MWLQHIEAKTNTGFNLKMIELLLTMKQLIIVNQHHQKSNILQLSLHQIFLALYSYHLIVYFIINIISKCFQLMLKLVILLVQYIVYLYIIKIITCCNMWMLSFVYLKYSEHVTFIFSLLMVQKKKSVFCWLFQEKKKECLVDPTYLSATVTSIRKWSTLRKTSFVSESLSFRSANANGHLINNVYLKFWLIWMTSATKVLLQRSSP